LLKVVLSVLSVIYAPAVQGIEIFFAPNDRAMFLVLMLDFAVVNLGVGPIECSEGRYPLLKAKM